MFWFVPCAFFSTNNFAHALLCRSYECMNIVRVNIGFFTGFKKIKQRRISFVLGYLHMILRKNSTAISIKHRILATFNIKKSILTACMPLTNIKMYKYRMVFVLLLSVAGVNMYYLYYVCLRQWYICTKPPWWYKDVCICHDCGSPYIRSPVG